MSNRRRRPELTVVVTARDAGLHLHATIFAADRAARRLEAGGHVVERLVVLHVPDAPTEDWVATRLPPSWTVERCDDPAVGPARNAAARAAGGNWIAFLDGGNLCSELWLSETLSLSRETAGDAVWHPEATIGFGPYYFADAGHEMTLNPDFLEDGLDYGALIWSNPYTSTLIVPRAIVDRVPFPLDDGASGWTRTDWWWCCNVAGAGFHHRIVPGTFEYRRMGRFGEPHVAPPLGRVGPTALAVGRNLPGIPFRARLRR